MKKIALIGSTGSIGRQVLEVVDENVDKFKIVSLAANKNYALLTEQMSRYKPVIATLSDQMSASRITEIPSETTFYYGQNAIKHAVNVDCDVVVIATVGFSGLEAVIEAIKLKKPIALANKESLVAGGEIVTKLAKQNNVPIIPIDSEHSAIWQSLDFDLNKPFKNLILTCSGGAFRDVPLENFDKLTKEQALLHPNWKMGDKITIDCATMANKGFEVAEAKWLFSCDLDKIKVVIHRQSIIHSMVEFNDNSVICQMSNPDMKIPIALSLSYPERLKSQTPPIDFWGLNLSFERVDINRYPNFDLVIKSLKMGKNYPCAISSSNEVAVDMFLKGQIKFTQIYDINSFVLDSIKQEKVTLESLIETDKKARSLALGRLSHF